MSDPNKPDAIRYDDGLETNIFDIAKQICAEPPKEPCSIQLVMDHDVDTDVEFDLVKDFTLGCLWALFGVNITPCDLNEQQCDQLNQYVKSIGYQMSVNKQEDETSYTFKITFDRYQSPKPNPFEHLRKYTSP